MRKSSHHFSLLKVLGTALVLAALAGCSSATDSTTTSTPSSSVFHVSYSGAASTTSTNNWGWSNAYIGVTPATGKTITNAAFTYAFDANFVSNLTDTGIDWFTYDGTTSATAFTWVVEFATKSVPKANTWYTETLTTDQAAGISTTTGVAVKLWDESNNAAASVYIKSVTLTYSDASTETLTFTDTTGAKVHSSTAGDVTLSSRVYVDTSVQAVNCVSPTQGIKTVAF